MAVKEYAGGAAPTTLTASITNVSGSCAVADATNWPTGAGGQFWIKMNAGLSNEEKILCASRVGNNITFAAGGRGGDGTAATSHDPPATVEHVFTAEDAREANDHVFNATRDDHGQYLNVVRHDLAARHAPGVVPASSTVADLNGDADDGSAGSFSLGDHKHGYPTWSTYAPTPSGFTVGNGSLTGRYLRVGKLLVGLDIAFVAGSTSGFSSIWSVSLPPAITVVSGTYVTGILSMVGGVVPVMALLNGVSIAFVYAPDFAPVNTALNIVSNTYPQAWATNDSLTIHGASIELS